MQPENEDEQGFFTEHIEIKKASVYNCKSPLLLTMPEFSKSPFDTKVLPWTGIFKKQPSQSLNTDYQFGSNTFEAGERRKNKPTHKDHPYKLYSTNNNYQLIYSRVSGDPILNSPSFLKNQVKLEHIGNTAPTDFKKIKKFQETSLQPKPGILELDSHFECGNLHCAYKHEKSQQYILFIENDTNSLGYNQWFYFSVKGNEANVKYTFRLMNFKKKNSFFKYGNKPAVFSLDQHRKNGHGWSKRGMNIIYDESPIIIPEFPNNKFYCLSFDITFETKDDYILIAMGLPYSYTKLISFLKQVDAESTKNKNIQFSVKSISKTVCGNDVPEVTITKRSEVENKKIILFMARQHPGEIWSSYMMEGVIRRLIFHHEEEEINWLLEHYIFIIFPMINIDGVIYGNFRCDITGVDLNRRWKDTPKMLHPQVHDIKRKIAQYRARARIDVCYDLHGHSKNYNIFAYSCKDNSYTCRILPYLISKKNPTFYMPSCTFGISKYKESTARAAIYKIVKNQNVLTIESSFFGSKLNGVVKQFGVLDLFKMSEDILSATRWFCDKKSKAFTAAKKEIETKIKQFMKYDEVNQFDSGSESDPSGDQIDLEIKLQQIFNKTYVNKQALFLTKSPSKQSKSVSPEKTRVAKEEVKEETETKQVPHRKSIINHHIIMKEIPMFQKPTHTIEHDSKLRSSRITGIKSKGKQTISYSQHKNYDDNSSETSENLKTKKIFRQNHKKFSLKHQPKEQKSENVIKEKKIKMVSQSSIEKPQVLESIDFPVEESKAGIEQSRKSQQFTKRFERFIPMSMKSRGHSMFEEEIYNEDQSNLISMLLENKRKIQLQKIKRDCSGREKQRFQGEKRRLSISARSNRIQRLINKSGNNLATIISHTFDDPQF